MNFGPSPCIRLLTWKEAFFFTGNFEKKNYWRRCELNAFWYDHITRTNKFKERKKKNNPRSLENK